MADTKGRWRSFAADFGSLFQGASESVPTTEDPLRRGGVIGFIAWLSMCLTLAAFALLLAISPWRYAAVLHEDGPAEDLTAVAYLLAGLALFAAAWRRRVGMPRLVLAGLGVLMVFIAGEEVSWGQRILGFATPDFLSRNTQGEATIHNLPEFGGHLLALGIGFMMVPCILGVAGALGRRDALLGIPLPSLPLALTALVALAWRGGLATDGRETDISFWLGFAFDGANVPFLILAAYATITRHIKLLWVVMGTQACCAAFGYVNAHTVKSPRIPSMELQELLSGLFWLGYAAQALLGQRRLGNEGHLGGAVLPHPTWSLAGLGLLALGVGTAALEGLSAGEARVGHGRAMLAEARRLLEPYTPTADTPFDIEVRDGRVVYLKRPCSRADLTAGTFFLEVFPEYPDELSLDRSRPVRSATWVFRFPWHGALVDGVCGAVVPLPDYPIARVRATQFNRIEQLWEVWLPGRTRTSLEVAPAAG